MITISTLRKKTGITQEELSNKLHISQQAISQYELGNREPDLKTLCKLADIFDVSVDYLLGRVDEDAIKVVKEAIPLSDDESQMLNAYRKCSSDGKTYLLGQALITSVVGPPVAHAEQTASKESDTGKEGRKLLA